eukprot:9974157-Alexandrium_andersonii.AAC.1
MEFRKRLVDATVRIANALARDVARPTPQQRAEFEAAFETWQGEREEKARGPTYAPKLGGKYLSDYESQ